ncbi:ferrochelatase [Tsukamurella sp. 8F]|uniref:ferrochelatase n=1 Tax=unclassified Tsukamurella TaxID=2633480 RepID=UPI0023B93D42|nr:MULTISPECIES: ferrochelatase [unclassified Tsukamurella]MDF0529261.1 ferrochelatase [Tsukamurella sp. 8J]MDF0586902.1 ferrochelatase [Tsukamurella sp. 8F]
MSADYDSVLVLSFGGPEAPEDVRPFLENVTRGRGVPAARLDEVEKHYLRFGGVSPINEQVRYLVSNLRAELAARGPNLPVYQGNRNWHPLVEDTVEQMAADGRRNALVFTTSAWGGFSGCRQYDEDIARARASVGATRAGRGCERSVVSAPHLTKLPHYWSRPELLDAFADGVRAAAAAVPDGSRLVFTAHSIPQAADAVAGPDGGLYSRQVRLAAAAVAARVGVADYDVVWQSRSGPPAVPWLEPDVCDHISAIHADIPGIVVCPIGFVSDHLEVIWDLDTEARDLASELSLPFARSATPLYDPRFTAMAAALIRERTSGAELPPDLLGCTVDGAACVPGCCPSARPKRPA